MVGEGPRIRASRRNPQHVGAQRAGGAHAIWDGCSNGMVRARLEKPGQPNWGSQVEEGVTSWICLPTTVDVHEVLGAGLRGECRVSQQNCTRTSTDGGDPGKAWAFLGGYGPRARVARTPLACTS